MMRIAACVVLTALGAQAAEIVGVGVVQQEKARAEGVVAADGSVKVVCPEPGGWTFELKKTAEAADVVEYRLALSAPQAGEPPAFTVEVRTPKTDMPYEWTPIFGCYGRLPLPSWAHCYAVQRTLPILARFNGDNRNRQTLSASEVRKDIVLKAGFSEVDFNVVDRIRFFGGVKDACTRYETYVRIDRRDVFWSDAVRDAEKWIVARSGAPKAMPVPAFAYSPLYSTWYNHHHEIDAAKVERELRLAADLGMGTVILDAGWECDDAAADGPSSCGDWEVSKLRFPDMAAHVKKVHELGLKYMVWYAVPFVGKDMKAARRFKGKFLYSFGKKGALALDPRFPDVREYLVSTYEKALREWDIDGFKLDFIDQIETRDRPDPAIAENFAGRDCRTVPEGVERLMTAVATRLRAIKPDVLIEFRAAYYGPAIRACGNMMRVGDCPGQWAANRVGTVNLRLVCPESCVHGDMIRWPKEDTVEDAARYVLSSLFGTVQYSVVLDGLDPRQTQMLRHWIAFSKRHLNALQKGELRAYHPECDYPVVEGRSGNERVILVSTAGFVADVPADGSVWVLNATGTDSLLLRSAAGRRAKVFDVCGKAVGTVDLPAGLGSVPVPKSGYLELIR